MAASYAEVVHHAQAAFTPFGLASGTENVAPLLYSLARMIRPRTIVEYGSGYTTLFLLAACAHNAADVAEEGVLLRAKTTAMKSSAEWLGGGGKACGVDPGFYLRPYTPHLYCFERLSCGSEYGKRMHAAVAGLELSPWLTYTEGSAFDLTTLPADAQPVDLAWNDDDRYVDFFAHVWPRLNPRGGLMIFHNTAGVEDHWRAMQEIQRQVAVGDVETLMLSEPHKLAQNSCTILRRTSEFEPSWRSRTRATVLADLVQLMS